MANNDKPANILNQGDLFYSSIESGDKIHLKVCGPGQVTDDAVFIESIFDIEMRLARGIRVSIKGEEVDILWGDIVEFWPLPKPPPVFQTGKPVQEL